LKKGAGPNSSFLKNLFLYFSGKIYSGSSFVIKADISSFNPKAPIAQKIADEVVFRRFQGEGVEFFLNRTSLTPPLDF